MLLFLTAALLSAPPMPSGETVARFEARTAAPPAGDQPERAMSYRLLKPAKIEAGKKYPLVLFLHGAGERGDDNKHQLIYFPELMASDEYQKRFPCFLIAPQCPAGKWWIARMGKPAEIDSVEQILQDAIKEFPVDPRRVYITGISMGGFGTWALAQRHPDWFAAAVPICGGGDPERADRLAKLPVWAVHGDKDPVVPITLSRLMIEGIRKAGGDPKFSELAGVGHDSWTPAYSDRDGVIPWMFEQVKPEDK